MHRFRGSVRAIAVLLGLALLASCAVRQWQWLEEAEAEAKTFSADPAMSLLYIYRDQSIAPTVRVGITLDGNLIGTLETNTFVVCRASPGDHQIASLESEPSVLNLQTETGGLYFIRHEYGDMTEGGHTSLRRVEAAQARQTIRDLQMIASACSESRRIAREQ